MSAALRWLGIIIPVLLVVAVVGAGAGWANYADWVTDPEDYQLFPPFKPFVNRLDTRHLGAEYLCISRALRAGRGFADPFKEETGPTAWMPPVLPCLQAAVLWAADDDEEVLMWVVVGAQTFTLVLTGWLVLAAAWRALSRPRRWLVVPLYAVFLLYDFHHAFQVTHDSWLQLLVMNALLLGFAVLSDRPSRWGAVLWGATGGLGALAGPVLGLAWGVLTAVRWPVASTRRRWALALAAAGVVMLPWAVRNYRVFGKVIPVKGNVFYELYQSQCLTTDGLVGGGKGHGFDTHPYGHNGPERDLYRDLGEAKFLDVKRAKFLAALRAAPGDFLVRVWNRLAAATLEYIPTDRKDDKKPTTAWEDFIAVVHPLPALAVLVLVVVPRPWHRYERAAVAVYVGWLLPYIVVSYYGRYGFPLTGVKVFLCVAAADRLLAGVGAMFVRLSERGALAPRGSAGAAQLSQGPSGG